MAKKRYTRVEEEIIQILNEADREPAWRRIRLPRRSFRPPRPPRSSRWDPAWTPLVAAYGLALAAILVADRSQTLATLLGILSILAFLSPIVLWRQPGPMLGPPVHRWRGRDITLAPRRTGLIGEIRYQIWRLRNRR